MLLCFLLCDVLNFNTTSWAVPVHLALHCFYRIIAANEGETFVLFSMRDNLPKDIKE